MSHIIDIFEVARAKTTVTGTIPLDEMPELALSVAEVEGEGLRYEITGMGTIERLPAATLKIEGDVVMACARCMQSVTVPVDREVVFCFVKNEEEADNLPLEEEDDEIEVIVGSRRLSIAAWVQEETILSLPSMPMHEDCDLDWEEEEDEEIPVEEEKPNPFAALAALKTKH